LRKRSVNSMEYYNCKELAMAHARHRSRVERLNLLVYNASGALESQYSWSDEKDAA
jgi:hypothetical protein